MLIGDRYILQLMYPEAIPVYYVGHIGDCFEITTLKERATILDEYQLEDVTNYFDMVGHPYVEINVE